MKQLSEKYTWFSNDGKKKSVLDYILSEQYVNQYVARCAVDLDCKVESDHRLVFTDLVNPCTKRSGLKKRKTKERPINWKELETKEIRELFVKDVVTNMSITKEHESIRKKSEYLVTILKQAAQISIPARSKKCTHEIWKHDEILNLYLEER